MTLLAIDTSTDYAGVCLYDGAVRYEVTWRSGRNHTVEVAERIETMLRNEGVTPAQLAGIAVAIGPGSFSGVRVGVALAKSMALSLTLPIVGIPTLDAIAHGFAWFQGDIRPVIDGGRGQIATGRYAGGDGIATMMTGPALADLRSLLPPDSLTLFCGEVTDEQAGEITRLGGPYARIAGSASRARRAGYLAELAQARIDRGQLNDPVSLQPVYLRRPAVLDRTPIADDVARLRSGTCPT